MGEEIFGPILPVLTYDDLDGLLSHLQERPPHWPSISSPAAAETERRVLGALRFGGGCVNDAVVHLAVSGLPFGGVGESGMGAYHGKAGFDTFTHCRACFAGGGWDFSCCGIGPATTERSDFTQKADEIGEKKEWQSYTSVTWGHGLL